MYSCKGFVETPHLLTRTKQRARVSLPRHTPARDQLRVDTEQLTTTRIPLSFSVYKRKFLLFYNELHKCASESGRSSVVVDFYRMWRVRETYAVKKAMLCSTHSPADGHEANTCTCGRCFEIEYSSFADSLWNL